MVTKTQTRTSSPRPSAAPSGETTGPLVEPTRLDDGDEGVTGATGNIGDKASALITENPKPKAAGNLFTLVATNVSKAASVKAELMGTVRQRLEHSRQLFAQGDDKAAEASEIAEKAGVALYQAQVAGTLSKDEITAALGDVFGYKQKKDGTPSKTPQGQGEVLRKRIVRAVSAAEFIGNGDGGRFFGGMTASDVEPIVLSLNEGNLSIWQAYDRLAEIKREHMVKTNAAFDPKRIAALVASLSEEGAGDIVRSNPALVAAYGALIKVLMILGEVSEEEAEAVAAEAVPPAQTEPQAMAA